MPFEFLRRDGAEIVGLCQKFSKISALAYILFQATVENTFQKIAPGFRCIIMLVAKNKIPKSTLYSG